MAESVLGGGLLAAGWLLGWVGGDAGIGAGMGLLAYSGWHVRNVLRLAASLRGDGDPPESIGLWGELFERLYRARREATVTRRRLAQIVQRFEEASAALPDAAVALGEFGAIDWCNEAAQRLLGLRMPRDLGQRITNVVRDPIFARYLGGEGDRVAGVEFEAPQGDGLILHARLIDIGTHRRLLVVRDVTQARRLEQVRRDFVANASHELRTPLTVVYGFLETLATDADELPPRWRRPLELMTQQTLRMQRIVDDMLMLAQLESDGAHAESDINVPNLLQQIRNEAIALSGGRRHRVELEVDPRLWLRGNETELRSAFSNLVANAVQHTPDGTLITVRWQLRDGRPVLEVEDNGEGIAPEHLPRLSERFYRVDASRSRARGGTGLGLAIVKHALARHDAELLIRSQVGVGSAFSCVFPASAARRPALAVTNAASV
ncbi:phosphate regulon sensor histidine kinase PhoR [Immundisolibacter sp.]|uniref:phosphate regulon sensor histidine kinase PhoR n=1 Tax=Immundisolibacter sp. TaxID=1934948 RepID=UPI00262071BE|nr:phosphate regulon sensor histidine kinase PhoR [Immundisolibacter sp.]MDD3650698.1 phosphate regulon sensor histidine kinase PhoR [Immundisolibacter sp.]